MYMDKELMVSMAQVVTASAASTDYIDLGANGGVGVGSDLVMCVTIHDAVTAAGAATVEVQLQCDDNPAFSSPKVAGTSGAIGKANLGAGTQFFIPLPAALDEQYVRVYYNVATGPLTGGTFSAAVVEGPQHDKHLPTA